MPGTLFVVATPIGNLEDVSSRALRVLREVAVIAAEDTRRTGQLLARYGITTPTTSLHLHNESGKAPDLVARLTAGDSIALVSDAGTPTVSDPGELLIVAAISAGIRVEPIPGPSAVLALLAVSGLPTETFAFLGFVPTKATDRNTWLADLANQQRTVIFFESPHRIVSTLERLRSIYGECHIVVGRELTKAHEQVIRGPVSEVISTLAEPRGEIVVGLNVGQSTDIMQAEPPADDRIALEFLSIAKTPGVSRRKAIVNTARRLGISPNQVYEAVERYKSSVE